MTPTPIKESAKLTANYSVCVENDTAIMFNNNVLYHYL